MMIPMNKKSKKIHRFLVEDIPDAPSFSITEQALVHQITTVLQLRIGEDVILFTDGGSDEVVTITALQKTAIEVERKETLQSTAPQRRLTAVVGIPKGSAFELVVQKLTEIGVVQIVPLLSKRTVKSGVRLSRLQTISKEALEQSGGTTRVIIHEPMTLAAALSSLKGDAVVCSQEGAASGELSLADTIVMYVGPEGGWDDDDWKLFHEYGAKALALAPRTLRTETAAIIGAYTLLWNR